MTPEKNKSIIALYAGTFDGITRGHLDIVRRSAELFNRLVVGVAKNTSKSPLFTMEERVGMIREETREIANVEVTLFEGLTMDYAEKIGANIVIRGLRIISDFEYELQMAMMNRTLNPRVETLFMFPTADHLHISSSMIKEVLLLGGEVSKFVPPATEKCLREKLGSIR